MIAARSSGNPTIVKSPKKTALEAVFSCSSRSGLRAASFLLGQSMIELPSSIGFQPSYPQLTMPTSQTKYGGRTISTVEYADSYRTVDMETVLLAAGFIMLN